MAQLRAKRGGQIGTNGEFYEGGKFLPTTGLPKRQAIHRTRGIRRVLVAPGVLDHAPEGKSAIYSRISEFVRVDGEQLVIAREPDHAAHAYYFEGGYDELVSLVVRFNEGERYL